MYVKVYKLSDLVGYAYIHVVHIVNNGYPIILEIINTWEHPVTDVRHAFCTQQAKQF